MDEIDYVHTSHVLEILLMIKRKINKFKKFKFDKFKSNRLENSVHKREPN